MPSFILVSGIKTAEDLVSILLSELSEAKSHTHIPHHTHTRSSHTAHTQHIYLILTRVECWELWGCVYMCARTRHSIGPHSARYYEGKCDVKRNRESVCVQYYTCVLLLCGCVCVLARGGIGRDSVGYQRKCHKYLLKCDFSGYAAVMWFDAVGFPRPIMPPPSLQTYSILPSLSQAPRRAAFRFGSCHNIIIIAHQPSSYCYAHQCVCLCVHAIPITSHCLRW